MTLRTAALYGHDPTDLRTSAEMLALRGVHPDVAAAEAALVAVREKGTPDRPEKRRSLRTWVHSGFLLLVFGGFMSPSAAKEDKGTLGKVKAVFSVVVGVGIWVTTWVFPVTFMVAMAWGCETHARQLGRRALLYYDGDATSVLDAIKVAGERQAKATTSARSCVPSRCSCRSPFPSASSHTSITSTRRPGSIGLARWARSLPSRW